VSTGQNNLWRSADAGQLVVPPAVTDPKWEIVLVGVNSAI
jgi:hypothetical protein